MSQKRPAFAGVLATTDQALVDLEFSRGSEVAFVHAPTALEAAEFARASVDRARSAGFAVARLSLARHPIVALDDVVRAVALSLEVDGAKRPGLPALLDRYARSHGAKASARFEAACDELSAVGDLSTLCRSYLASHNAPKRVLERLSGWLDGVAFARAEESSAVLATLTPRTAKRALVELSRVLVALDVRGTLVFFEDGESLLKLTRRRRDDAYTVLRELVDDGDGLAGLVSVRLVVSGTTPLFEGASSLASLAPLASRVAQLPHGFGVAPHRPLIDLSASVDDEHAPSPTEPRKGSERAMRTMVRAAHGLPPIESVVSMSVGHDRIDATIDKLFATAGAAGSAFALLTGPYGSGKTHSLLHLTERALAEKRPVFRLSIERLDQDLGSPQRHLRRLLDQSLLPGRGNVTRDSALDRLSAWVRDPAKLARIVAAIDELATEDSDCGVAAKRAQKHLSAAKTAKGAALETFLSGEGLLEKPSAPSYRIDAYRRLLLWIALLMKCDGMSGPVFIVDEAENLFTGGATSPERRTAIRSLSFYCCGALPAACVVLAITPDALTQLREDAATHVEDLAAQETTLEQEDVSHFGRRLARCPVSPVPALASEHLVELAAQVKKTHAHARGVVHDPGWDLFVAQSATALGTPRSFVRALVDRLESLWWAAR